MPDIAVCNSTVCSVQYKCARNWSSKIYEADREPNEQEWVPMIQMRGASEPFRFGVGYSEGCRASDCSYWMPMNDQVNDLPENFTYNEVIKGLPYKRINGVIDRSQ